MRAIAGAFALALMVGGRPGVQAHDDYRTLVEAYRRDPDRTLDRLAQIPDGDPARNIARATRSGPGWTSDDLDAATLMETEAAFARSNDPDGIQIGLSRAATLVDAAARDEGNIWFVARWYRGVLGVLGQDRGKRATAQWLSTRLRAQAWFDPADNLEHFIQLELRANQTLRIGRAAGEGWDTYTSAPLRQAIPQFEWALQRHPSLPIAAVHLARVQMLSGNGPDARRLFEQARISRDPLARYYAYQFLGAFEEQAGHLDAAEASYRSAMALFPGAKSAMVALAALLARRARGPDAAALLAVFGSPNPARFDPWWIYFPPVEPPTVSSLMRDLRAEILR